MIDDDKDVHTYIQIVLQKAGYNLISAFDGNEGLKKVLSFNPDLIILDYLMPKKNGSETFKELKKSQQYERYRDIPVIMLTATDQRPERIKQLLEAGLNAYLEKPFGNKELLNVIENTFITNKIKVRNQTLRKAVENSKNFLENLLESCPMAIITCELGGKITFVSKGIEDILGYSTSEVLGKSVYELLGTSKKVLTGSLESGDSQNKLVTNGIYVEAKSGIQIPMGITCSYLKDQNGDIHGLLFVGQDLSAQKQLEKELLEKLFGKQTFIENITERIKTFEDACKVLKIKPDLPDVSAMPKKHQKALIAHYKLVIIAEALNEGWEPDWSDYNEYKHYPWFEYSKAGSGFSFVSSYWTDTFTRTSGSRLCFKTKALAE
ncbi:response regulator, partial [candidate division KSB1 bacterium]|nr:response regulator [candidate division KSB1 bacterium]